MKFIRKYSWEISAVVLAISLISIPFFVPEKDMSSVYIKECYCIVSAQGDTLFLEKSKMDDKSRNEMENYLYYGAIIFEDEIFD